MAKHADPSLKSNTKQQLSKDYNCATKRFKNWKWNFVRDKFYPILDDNYFYSEWFNNCYDLYILASLIKILLTLT